MNAWRIVESQRGTDDSIPILEFNPLPYDSEIKSAEKGQATRDQQENVELMKWAKENNYFNTPIWQQGTS